MQIMIIIIIIIIIKKTLTRTVQYLREYSHFSYDLIKALTTDNYSLMSIVI